MALDDGTTIPQLDFGGYQIPPAQTADPMAAISALDRGVKGRRGPDPATFDWIPDR